MKLFVTLFLCLVVSTAFSQADSVWVEPSKESQAYHEMRLKPTVPPYGLAKVKALIAGIKMDEEDNEALTTKQYQSLSAREKFTYHMIHAESYSQNCDAMPPILDEHKKIFARVPDAFGEFAWSARQKKFLKDNRDSVIGWLKESMQRTHRVGVNYKQAIIEINAVELIPVLIETYRLKRQDYDILTVLMNLMSENKYDPFLKSASFKKLYGNDADYQAYINFNAANEELIIKRAQDLYAK